MEPELIADYECECGEGPLWHPLEKRLYWVDIPKGRIFRFDPATGKHEICYEDEPVGGFTIQEDGALLLFRTKGEVVIWRDGEIRHVIKEIPEERETHFNDVIADPAGRVFCGTIAEKGEPGRLYRLDTDGSITKVLDNIGCSNGMGFTLDRKQMYYTDTRALTIYLFDYDREKNSGMPLMPSLSRNKPPAPGPFSALLPPPAVVTYISVRSSPPKVTLDTFLAGKRMRSPSKPCGV